IRHLPVPKAASMAERNRSWAEPSARARSARPRAVAAMATTTACTRIACALGIAPPDARRHEYRVASSGREAGRGVRRSGLTWSVEILPAEVRTTFKEQALRPIVVFFPRCGEGDGEP